LGGLVDFSRWISRAVMPSDIVSGMVDTLLDLD
jgi:hypothetical protein